MGDRIGHRYEINKHCLKVKYNNAMQLVLQDKFQNCHSWRFVHLFFLEALVDKSEGILRATFIGYKDEYSIESEHSYDISVAVLMYDL
jgi:hypothetical protein